MRVHYKIIKETPAEIVIRDVGPWDQFLTVTNGAEKVVEELNQTLKNRRLFYYDSEGDYGELVYKNGKFLRFASAKP